MNATALDIGATWIKIAEFDVDSGQIVKAVRKEPFPVSIANDKIDVHQVTLMRVIGSIQTKQVFICSQMGGYRDGAVWVSWMDRRADGSTSEDVPLGEIASDALLASGHEVPLPPIGDHQAALLGAEVKKGDLSVNVGTGAQVSFVADARSQPPVGAKARRFFGELSLHACTKLLAGRHLQETARIWGVDVDHPSLLPFLELMANDYGLNASRLSPATGHIVLTGGVMEKSERLRDLTFKSCGERPVRLVFDATLKGLAKYSQISRNVL